LTLGMGCCICQWTVSSINGCCTLMATNPTCSSSMYFLCRMIFILLYWCLLFINVVCIIPMIYTSIWQAPSQ
jgi:hypothetical protein